MFASCRSHNTNRIKLILLCQKNHCEWGSWASTYVYGVAMISRLLKIIGLLCRISSLLLSSFAKEAYNFKEPTNRSHPINAYFNRSHPIPQTSWAPPCSGTVHRAKAGVTILKNQPYFVLPKKIMQAVHVAVALWISNDVLYMNTKTHTLDYSHTATHCNTLQHTATQ